jgi:hypothetical protein
MSAGACQLTREGPDLSLSIRSASGKNRLNLPVLTRDSSSEQSVRAVFDRAGDTRFLSEVWLPSEDGLLLRVSSKEHVHEVLAPKKN